jgi:chromosome segregation ATPase
MVKARRSKNGAHPRLADLVAEMRELRADQAAVRAQLEEQREALRIQFERIAQLQATLDESATTREQLAESLTQLRRRASS